MVNQPLGVERFFSALRCLFVNEIIASERTLSEDGLMMTRPPFDLQQLRCLVVLSETLHFGHAAVRLNMTQPPLSRQIALLEESMGVRLFQRDRRSVTWNSFHSRANSNKLSRVTPGKISPSKGGVTNSRSDLII